MTIRSHWFHVTLRVFLAVLLLGLFACESTQKKDDDKASDGELAGLSDNELDARIAKLANQIPDADIPESKYDAMRQKEQAEAEGMKPVPGAYAVDQRTGKTMQKYESVQGGVRWVEIPGQDIELVQDDQSQSHAQTLPEIKPEEKVQQVSEPAQNRTLSRDELVAQLAAYLEQKHDDALMLRASKAMLLDVAAGGKGEIDPALFKRLSSRQREQLERFRRLNHYLLLEMAEGSPALSASAAAEAIEQYFGPSPVSVRRAELCRSVRGYGVYEPIKKEGFIAGAKNKMILYLELDDFATEKEGDWHRIDLSQEVVLFDAPSGTKVWGIKPQALTDRSRNVRRDFFTTQMIELPTNVGVGEYILKVRVTDRNAQTVDEVSVPIKVIAAPPVQATARPLGG